MGSRKVGQALLAALVVLVSAAASALAQVQDIACDDTPFRMNFRGMTCEAVLGAPTEDGRGRLDYYGVFGEYGQRFRNVELAVAGPGSHVNTALAPDLRALLKERFFWLAKARNWSAEQKADDLTYLTFDLPFGACAGFITYAEPLSQSFKYALNGVVCRKSGRTYDLDDLREAMNEIDYETE